MTYSKFDRSQLKFYPLVNRNNKVNIEKDHIPVKQVPQGINEKGLQLVEKTAERIKTAIRLNRSSMLAFGAHTIKNGLAPALISLMEEGWVTHLATNGAGIIHDWEFAFQGKSSEDVRENVRLGKFGNWEETGFYINLALVAGAYEGIGYGESVGKMIFNEGIEIPKISSLHKIALAKMKEEPSASAAAIDFAGVINQFKLKPGWMSIPHPYKHFSVQGNAYQHKIPFTGHPMFGHDIIYNHPMNHGASIGRTAERDFLCFVKSVCNLEDGVYMSVGSAVMSPMIFEKSLSMAQNIEIQKGSHIDRHFMLIVDLATSEWDWEKDGEPPADNPAYYLRYCKTFSRMGGEMHYLTADNRSFLLALCNKLRNHSH